MSSAPPVTRRERVPSALRRRLLALLIAVPCVFGAVYLAQSGVQSQVLDRQQAPAGIDQRDFVAGPDPAPPNVIRARLLRAYALRDLGRDRDAARAFALAARREPRNWVIQRDLAIALARSGDLDAATAALQRAIALNPRLPIPTGFSF